MTYHLLTGATGLLGSYLLRDCAAEDVPLAVVVRPTKRQTARQRIESVLTRWEQDLGFSLPRPVVLEGDLTQPRLGLDRDDVRWVADHCSSIIHNAASLTFVKTKAGEPYRSNVEGTQHVLQLCQEAGIRCFHHVSTAYVCGLRQGRVLETELDVGQQPGNDYERSKIESERMVTEADFLDQPVTVFRPSIIIGDSQTGFTTTYHGFYSPLRIAQALFQRIPPGSVDLEYAASLLQLFRLNGTERKNFVPVDWVSQVMASIIARPEHHGRVYHLTPANGVPISEMVDVMSEAIGEHLAKYPPHPNGRAVSVEFFEEFFQEQLSVYQAYWRDDPEFDCTNTKDAAPVECPEIDREMLLTMCRYAIEAKFGFVPQTVAGDSPDLDRLIQARVTEPEPAPGSPSFLGLQINGAGGGQWELELQNGALASARPGLSRRCSATLYLNSHTFRHLQEAPSDVWESLQSGSVLVEGNGLTLEQIVKVLASVTR